MPKLKIHVHRLTDYFLANTDTAYLAKYQYGRIGYLAKLDWENTICHRERNLCCFFVNSRRRDVVGCPRMADTLPPVSQHNHIAYSRISLLYYALAQSRKDDITAYMDGYAVGCRRVIIDRHCSVYRCHNFMSHSRKLAQQCISVVAGHGTSLSSDVLIPRVRTLALCWTRCPTIAYKYHGSLLWIIQLATNITQTCRWIVNIFLTDAVAAEVENITWGVKSERFEIQRIWIPWKQEAKSSRKNS